MSKETWLERVLLGAIRSSRSRSIAAPLVILPIAAVVFWNVEFAAPKTRFVEGNVRLYIEANAAALRHVGAIESLHITPVKRAVGLKTRLATDRAGWYRVEVRDAMT